MTNTPKLLSREAIGAIRQRYFSTVLPKHSTPFGGCYSDKGVLDAKDFKALLAHIEAQDVLVDEAHSLVRDLLEVWDPEWEPGKSLHEEAVALLAKVETMKESGNATD